MNYMPEVLKMLGVEVGEKFNINPLIDSPYHFDEDYILVNKNGHNVDDDKVVQILILTGVLEIEKLPWKPKDGENYWCVIANGDKVKVLWCGYMKDFYLYNAGNCFRTHEEITGEIKNRILSEMKGKYESL